MTDPLRATPHTNPTALLDRRELIAPVALCLPDGSLNPDAVGWTRRPLHHCALPVPRLRGKKWHHWCVTSEECLLAITYADLGYLGLCALWFLDLRTGRTFERTHAAPGGLGFDPPEEVFGDVAIDRLGLHVGFHDEPGGTRLEVRARDVGLHTLRAHVFVELPRGHETLGVVVPWDARRFQYTSKHTARPARGHVTLDGRTYTLGEAQGAFGCLDFGRGVWPYRTTWNWGATSARAGGHTVGVNLGARWTDGTGYTENAVTLDGRLLKVREPVRFAYERGRWRLPWSMRTLASDAVDLTFRPLFEKRARVELGVLAAELHLLVGRYTGAVRGPAGERVALRDAVGWAEELRARW